MTISSFINSKSYSFYEDKLKKEVEKGIIPNHIAIIMDGNRRYAKEVGTNPFEGHIAGKNKLKDVVQWCFELGVKNLTVYAFSTENFSRDGEEVDYLLNVIETSLREFSDDPLIEKHNVRLNVIGETDLMPSSLIDSIKYAEEKTKNNTSYNFNIAIAYGGRQEIVNAIKNLAQKVKDNEISIEDITEETVSNFLYTSEIPDPDLVLRTSGEIRISNFLLWQMAYSELYFTDIFWPSFRKVDLLRAIRAYQQRNRRYGK